MTENLQPQSQWSLLPIELLETISQRIASISDFVRFRCVCRSWRYAAKPLNLSPQPPWLLLPHDPTNTQRSFFSLSTGSTLTLDLPETLNQVICGSSNGWFVMFDKTLSFSLFNPLTRSLTRLPPIEITARLEEYISKIFRVGVELEIPWERVDAYFDCYGFISPHDRIVAFIYDEYPPHIQCWRHGDESWTMIDSGLSGSVHAMTLHKSRLFVIDDLGNVAICDLGPTRKATVIPSLRLPDEDYSYSSLVSSYEGLLLVICYHIHEDYFVYPRGMRFEYYKLDENEGRMNWSQLQGVGNCTVFLTEGLTTGDGKLMPVASSSRGHGRNCLCSVTAWKSYDIDGRKLRFMEIVLTQDGHEHIYGTWETPHRNLMTSSWIVPSLC